MPQFQHAIIVGASSGIGLALAQRLAREGTRVAVVARREDRLRALQEEGLLPFVHDVTRYEEVPDLFQKITHELGGLDLIVYAAGTMPPVQLDQYDFELDRQMVETNLLGAMAWLNEAAKRFQEVRRGTIIGIGSVAGDRGRRGQPAYNTSKAALATYLEALRNRLDRLGVKVVTIKPGPTHTEMTQALNLKRADQPEFVAERILACSRRSGEYYVHGLHRLIFFVIRHIPSGIFRKLSLP